MARRRQSQASEAFQRVCGGEMCAGFVGDSERLVGISRGVIVFPFCRADTSARGQTDGQPGSIGCGDGNVGPPAGDGQLATRQCRLGPRRDWHLFRRWAGESLNSKALDELHAYVDVMIADRCRKPGDRSAVRS